MPNYAATYRKYFIKLELDSREVPCHHDSIAAQAQAAQELDSAIADRAQDYRNRLAAAYQVAGRPADAEPLLQQLLDAEPEEGAELDLLTRLGSVQVPASFTNPDLTSHMHMRRKDLQVASQLVSTA